MKPSHMELGGHAPVIVCADTDPVKAAKTAVRAKIVNAGQVCTSPSRFLVDRRVYDAFTAAFVEAMAAIKVGNGLEPGVQMGPMVSHRRLAAVQKLIEDAVSAGATVATGGRPIEGKGFFYQPTVLTDVPAERGDPARGAVRPGRPGRRVRRPGRSDRGRELAALRAGRVRLHRLGRHGGEAHRGLRGGHPVHQPLRWLGAAGAFRRLQGERLRPGRRARGA